MTMRLSISSLAGTDRTLVAVGTLRLAAMLTAVRAVAPRSRDAWAPATAGPGADVTGAGEAAGRCGAAAGASAGAGAAAGALARPAGPAWAAAVAAGPPSWDGVRTGLLPGPPCAPALVPGLVVVLVAGPGPAPWSGAAARPRGRHRSRRAGSNRRRNSTRPCPRSPGQLGNAGRARRRAIRSARSPWPRRRRNARAVHPRPLRGPGLGCCFAEIRGLRRLRRHGGHRPLPMLDFCSLHGLPGYRRGRAPGPGLILHDRAGMRSLSCGESQFTYGPLGTMRLGLIQSWVW